MEFLDSAGRIAWYFALLYLWVGVSCIRLAVTNVLVINASGKHFHHNQLLFNSFLALVGITLVVASISSWVNGFLAMPLLVVLSIAGVVAEVTANRLCDDYRDMRGK